MDCWSSMWLVATSTWLQLPGSATLTLMLLLLLHFSFRKYSLLGNKTFNPPQSNIMR